MSIEEELPLINNIALTSSAPPRCFIFNAISCVYADRHFLDSRVITGPLLYECICVFVYVIIITTVMSEICVILTLQMLDCFFVGNIIYPLKV